MSVITGIMIVGLVSALIWMIYEIIVSPTWDGPEYEETPEDLPPG